MDLPEIYLSFFLSFFVTFDTLARRDIWKCSTSVIVILEIVFTLCHFGS
jgi:hypothetical protein